VNVKGEGRIGRDDIAGVQRLFFENGKIKISWTPTDMFLALFDINGVLTGEEASGVVVSTRAQVWVPRDGAPWKEEAALSVNPLAGRLKR
jgi:hypothetical protein